MFDYVVAGVGRELLKVVPLIFISVAAGLYTLAVVWLTKRAVRSRQEGKLLELAQEKAREVIRSRDQEISYLRKQLEAERELNRELTVRKKAAMVLLSKLNETLATADYTLMSRAG